MPPRARAAALIAGALVTGALLVPQTALAHALVGKQDLPIPAWLFAWGASIVLIVSFVVLSIAWRTPRLQEERWRPSSEWLTAIFLNPAMQALAGGVGVLLLVLTVYSGLNGTEAPDRNFSITFVFVTFWLGLVVLSVLFGDVFKPFNPWRAVGRFFGGVFRRVAGQSAPPPLEYPDRLGHWPAVAGFLGFVFLELIYGSGLSLGLLPENVAIAALVYSAITFVAMALFGVEKWIEKGETFSVYFRMFAHLSVFEARDGKIGRRKFLSGPPSWGQVPGSLALVLATIGATTYDGATEGALESPMTETFDLLNDIGLGVVAAFRVNGVLWLGLVILAVYGLYMLGVKGMHTVRDAPPVRELARGFAHSLIPIALAYLIAHYFSLILFQEQAQFTYLLSDPLGEGSDIFGTAGGGVDYGLIGATGVWYVQVGTLVAGHVAALTLAHDKAVSIWKDPQLAARSQYWMLAVMVGFTCLGLYLLSQANA